MKKSKILYAVIACEDLEQGDLLTVDEYGRVFKLKKGDIVCKKTFTEKLKELFKK